MDFIDDGYTEAGLIQAEPGRHGELRFEFRPACGEPRSKLVAAVGNQIEFDKLAVELLPKFLSSWSLKDSSGQSVPINRESLWKVRPNLRAKIVDVVFDFARNDARGSDVETDLKN